MRDSAPIPKDGNFRRHTITLTKAATARLNEEIHRRNAVIIGTVTAGTIIDEMILHKGGPLPESEYERELRASPVKPNGAADGTADAEKAGHA